MSIRWKDKPKRSPLFETFKRANMKLMSCRSLALFSALAFSIPSAVSSTSPKYGGTLRVELRATSISLDPREWKTGTLDFATGEKLGALVYGRLVALDNYGRFQPQLAAEWSHDAAFRRWQFVLRAGVKFSDRSVLTASDVAAALQPLLPTTQEIQASGNSVVIQSNAPIPDLLEQLASGRYFIYRVHADGTLLGTGPFFMSGPSRLSNRAEKSAVPAEQASDPEMTRGGTKDLHLHFRANEEIWSGRPFVDAIDVTIGVPPLRQLFDLQLGKADLIELSPELVRRAMQENLRVWTSAPVTLYGLRFDEAQPASADAKLREAVSLSLDRQTMANVLLQKQAEPAAALLPQWLSGYAFLFTMETNIDRAKEIRATLPASVAAGKEPLRLTVDASGDLAKLLGERVAVNARQAMLIVQVATRSAAHVSATTTATPGNPAPGLHLFAWHFSALSPRLELESFISAFNLGDSSENAVSTTDPEQLYAREKKLLEQRRVLPLVALPEYVGLGQNVRDWMPARWGEWHLADVWLDLPAPNPAQDYTSNSTATPAHPTAAPQPGAKP
jgi:ABC-type transport system substrate-binding protein